MLSFCVKRHVGVRPNTLAMSMKIDAQKKLNYTQVAPIMYGDQNWIQLP
jgi:hypothetical protein